MSLWQGVKGAQVELAAIQSPVQKLRRLASISKIFAAEVIGTIALAPFAARASSLYRSLPSIDSYDPTDVKPVYVAKDVAYSNAAPRNTVDIYLPTEAAANRQQQTHSRSKVPVVVFVHGGVWAAGDKWHYAPMAHCLARLGVLACVVSYSLYPDALVPQIVEEVSAAFDWAMEHVEEYGGDRKQVSLFGHSAGAQLCMMALLQRAKALQELQQNHQTKPNSSTQQQHNHLMPRQFVAVTGVYDIAKHYVYEKERGVHELSTMKRAMGGFEGFAAMSPAVILGAALQQKHRQHKQQSFDELNQQSPLRQQQQREGISSRAQQQAQQQQEPPACDFYSSFQLSGDSIAHRIGFDRGSGHYAAAEAALQLQSEVGMRDVMRFPLEAAAHLPPTILVSSCTDITVPWYESAEMYYKLLDAGVPVRHLVYNKVGHGDFVVDWPTRFSSETSSADDWGSGAAASNSSSYQAAPKSAPTTQIGLQENIGHNGTGNTAHNKIPSSETTDWGESEGSSGSAVAAQANSSQLQQQQRLAILLDLPHYCRDLAVITMGQQPINFVQRQHSATTEGLNALSTSLKSVATGAGMSDSNGDGKGFEQSSVAADDGSVDAVLLVDAVELN